MIQVAHLGSLHSLLNKPYHSNMTPVVNCLVVEFITHDIIEIESRMMQLFQSQHFMAFVNHMIKDVGVMFLNNQSGQLPVDNCNYDSFQKFHCPRSL